MQSITVSCFSELKRHRTCIVEAKQGSKQMNKKHFTQHLFVKHKSIIKILCLLCWQKRHYVT